MTTPAISIGFFRLLSGTVFYVAVMVLFVAAFKKGGSLTVLYPIYAITFVWSALIALLVYGTPIKMINVGGMAFFGLWHVSDGEVDSVY